jgi:hypothetical protein
MGLKQGKIFARQPRKNLVCTRGGQSILRCTARCQAHSKVAEGMPLAGADCHHAPKDDAMKVDAALKGCGSWPPAWP